MSKAIVDLRVSNIFVDLTNCFVTLLKELHGLVNFNRGLSFLVMNVESKCLIVQKHLPERLRSTAWLQGARGGEGGRARAQRITVSSTIMPKTETAKKVRIVE